MAGEALATDSAGKASSGNRVSTHYREISARHARVGALARWPDDQRPHWRGLPDRFLRAAGAPARTFPPIPGSNIALRVRAASGRKFQALLLAPRGEGAARAPAVGAGRGGVPVSSWFASPLVSLFRVSSAFVPAVHPASRPLRSLRASSALHALGAHELAQLLNASVHGRPDSVDLNYGCTGVKATDWCYRRFHL